MRPPSSSTSSSDPHPPRRGGAARLAAWALVWLILLDLAVGTVFSYPPDPREIDPDPMALYFDYGRSMEGRLRRMTRADPDETAPITLSGWYDPLVETVRPGAAGEPRVTIYGMSHAMRLADALHQVDPGLEVRSIGAPGATTNWAYGAFRRDRRRGESDVHVLAIMSSTLPMILSPAPMNWNSSFPLPYTADRYVVRDGGLQAIAPPYESFSDYVATLNDPRAWEQALDQFRRTDPFYDSWLLRQTWMDRSVILRLVRRAWGQRRDFLTRQDVLTRSGFDDDSEALVTARAILKAFARDSRRDGAMPVVYIVDSFGYGDQLSRALVGTMREHGIAYLSSSALIDPEDPGNYLADSHFTDAADRTLARALAEMVRRGSAQVSAPASSAATDAAR